MPGEIVRDSSAPPEEAAAAFLRRARVEVDPETFYLVGLGHREWLELTDRAALGPNRNASFMMLRDGHEVTLLLREADWREMRGAATAARVEANFRLVTLDVELGWDVVGFLAYVAGILAAARIPCGVISAFSRDHLLIRQNDLARALLALGPHVAELC